MNGRFPRKARIDIGITDGDSIDLVWDEAGQTFTLAVQRGGAPVRPRSLDLALYYDGLNKRKYSIEVQSPEGRGFTLSPEEVVRRYSQVWVIDTNRRDSFDRTFCVAAMCALNPDGSGTLERIGGHLFGKVDGNPERYGWRRWLQFLHPMTDPERRYAIIVDSEMGLLKAINDRTEAVHGDYVLPANFDVIYATSNKPDTILNKAMKAADALSKAMLVTFVKKRNEAYFDDLGDAEAHVPVFVFCAESARSA